MNYHANTHESTITCPRCGARPGELCRSKSGRIASQWHRDREYHESMVPFLRLLNEPKPSLFQRIIAIFKRAA